MTEVEIRKEVQRIVQKYNTTNPFELCDYLDIEVEREHLGTLKGYYYCHNRIKIIKINNSLDDKIAKKVCAHELGHALMHAFLNTMFLCAHTSIVVNKFENEANLFADILLELGKEMHIC